MRNYYEILKVPRTASPKEIKASYRRLCSQYHPDRNKDADATQKMQVLNEAWAVLSDSKKRAKHDADLSRHEQFEAFFREMEEAAEAEAKKADDDFVSTEDWEEPEDDEKIAAMQRYFEMAGASWVQQSRRDETYSRVAPTYRVYRTDFTVGNKLYYYYACYKSEIVEKWNEVKKDLRSNLDEYCSNTLSPRLVNQELMDIIFDNKGVLWSEGEPRGDVTAAFFRKG
jgi:curved DNA-binding protein CbpA